MSDRIPATTIGELDIHLRTVMDKIDDVQSTLATLATRAYVDEQLKQLREQIQSVRPANMLASVAKTLAAIMVVMTFFGAMYEFMSMAKAVRQSIPTAQPAK